MSNAVAIFEKQFEMEGDGYLYRQGMRAAAVRVTSAEHDAFLAQFARAQRWLMFAFVLVMLAAIVILVFVVPTPPGTDDPLLYVVIGAVIAVFYAACMRIWNAPARALDRRVRVRGPLSRSEARRRSLEKTTWLEIGAAGVAMTVAWLHFHRAWSTPVWREIWLASGAVLLAIVAWRAFQKISLDSK